MCNKNQNIFITITGMNRYLGLKPFKVGRIVKLCKEQNNEYDETAIRVELPFIDTVGYVANSTSTVYKGTFSAGRLYDKIGDEAFAEIMFVTHSSAIAILVHPEESENGDEFFEIDTVETNTTSKQTKESTNTIGFH